MTGMRTICFPDECRSALPRKLYRRFSCKEYAELLIAGDIRFRNLAYYRSIEDSARQDIMEGTRYQNISGWTIKIMDYDGLYGSSLSVTSGEFRNEITHPQKYFISCFSTRQNVTQKAFGPWLVTIRHADKLIRHMRTCLPHEGCLIWGRVNYYDPYDSPLLPDANHLWRQKPIKFRKEHEFRLGFAVAEHPNPTCATAKIPVADLSHIAQLTYSPEGNSQGYYESAERTAPSSEAET